MFVELFGPLVGLDGEWKRQGAADDEIDMTGFDWDFVRVVGCGGNTDIMGGFQPMVIEDTPEYILSRDVMGRTVKLPKSYATIGLPVEYPVKDMDSWLKIKPMYTFCPERIDWDAVEAAKKAQEQGALVLAPIPGGFDLPRELMGEEIACISYYENPELIHDILSTITETSFQVLDRISDRLQIDNLCVHEDMAGKSGPLIGPNFVLEFIKPYYSKIWDMLHSKGTRLFSQDSDGNMNAILDAMLECGVNITFPAEPAAGMDIVALREKYGKRLAFKGGIDKHVLRGTKEDIRRELEYKMQPMMREGGVAGERWLFSK